VFQGCGVCITEGGETSFVIGTAWKGVEVGAKVYFVYNNPDDVLCRHVERSREVIQDRASEKVKSHDRADGHHRSTRMQATSIQLAVMLTVLELVARANCLGGRASRRAPTERNIGSRGRSPSHITTQFLTQLSEIHATLKSPTVLAQLAKTHGAGGIRLSRRAEEQLLRRLRGH